MEASQLTKALRQALGGFSKPEAGSDAELLERFAAQHDEKAFEALVRRHGPMVLRLCQRMLSNNADAEDAFQAALIVLAKRAATIAKRPSVASWLHGVARHIALDVRRSASRRRSREQYLGDGAESVEGRPAPAGTPECDLRQILDEELGRIPERYRAPVVLCYLEGRSTDEAAAELGLARGTVASRVSRGRDLLRKRLARRGLALSAAALTAQLESTAAAAIPVATLHALVPAGFVSGTGIREGAAILAKGALQGMFWSKLRWGGILLACLVMLGTATVKWTATTNKPAGNAKGSTERGEDFYVRWRFDNGPPKDIQKLGGNWVRASKPGATLIPDAWFLLPTRIPKRPLVLSVKLTGFLQATGEANVDATWFDGNQDCAKDIWLSKTRIEGWKCTQPVYVYFVGHRALTKFGDVNGDWQPIRVYEYRVAYPAQRIAIRISNLAIQEIELRSLRPEEIPLELRHFEQAVKTRFDLRPR